MVMRVVNGPVSPNFSRSIGASAPPRRHTIYAYSTLLLCDLDLLLMQDRKTQRLGKAAGRRDGPGPARLSLCIRSFRRAFCSLLLSTFYVGVSISTAPSQPSTRCRTTRSIGSASTVSAVDSTGQTLG